MVDRIICASTGGIGLEARLYDSAARRVFTVRRERRFVEAVEAAYS
jgi:hypothetical protein